MFSFPPVLPLSRPADPREHDHVAAVAAPGLAVLGHDGASSDKSSHAQAEGRPRHRLLDPAPI